jgi:hypothetical protein
MIPVNNIKDVVANWVFRHRHWIPVGLLLGYVLLAILWCIQLL